MNIDSDTGSSIENKSKLRLVTGSCDTTVRVWGFEGDWENNHQGNWKEEMKVGGNPHSGKHFENVHICQEVNRVLNN